MVCKHCNSSIDSEREAFLLEYNKAHTCTNCSKESKVTGFMDYNHKTAPQLVLIPDDPEILRIAKRAFRRAR